MRVIIAGGRDFSDFDILSQEINKLFTNVNNPVIISGTARGADRLGERYAKLNKITLERYPADWDRYGKSAGYRRNEQMAKLSDTALIFWDGKSKGTNHMIKLSRIYKLKVKIITY